MTSKENVIALAAAVWPEASNITVEDDSSTPGLALRAFDAKGGIDLQIEGDTLDELQAKVEEVRQRRDRLISLRDGLEASGRLKEICGEDGNIVPSDAAIVRAEIEFSDAPEAGKRLVAQAQTLIDFAERCQAEMNSAPQAE